MKKMNSTDLIKKATESFERLDKNYNVNRVDYSKGYMACYMDIVHESKVIHNVSECDFCEDRKVEKPQYICKECEESFLNGSGR